MLKILDYLEEGIVTLLMGTATLIIFAAVLHRYSLGLAIQFDWNLLYDWLFDIDLSWAQELCIYLFVWMAKFGAAYGVRTGIHVGVDVLINQVGEPIRAKFILFGLLAGALFTGIVGTLGASFVWENGMHYAVLNTLGMDTGTLPEGPTTPDLEMPTWIVYLAIPLGSFLMCFRFLEVTWSFYRTGELPRHEHAHVEGLEAEVEQAQASGEPERVLIGESVSLTEEREHLHGGHWHELPETPDPKAPKGTDPDQQEKRP